MKRSESRSVVSDSLHQPHGILPARILEFGATQKQCPDKWRTTNFLMFKTSKQYMSWFSFS